MNARSRVLADGSREQIVAETPVGVPLWPALAPLAVLLAVVPLVPDVQLVRDKLLVLQLALWLGAAGYVAVTIATGRLVVRTVAAGLPSLFIGYLMVRALLASDRLSAAVEAGRWGAIATAAFLVSLAGPDERRWLLRCWVIGTGAAALYGAMQRWGGIGPILVPQHDRVMGLSGNPIFFAAMLVVFVPIAFVRALQERGWWRCIAGGAAAAAAVALVFTGTRAAFIGSGAAAIVLAWTLVRSRRVRFAIMGMVAALLIVSVVSVPAVWRRPQAHALIWRDALRLVAQRPMFGVGLGAFHSSFPAVASEELRAIWPHGRFIVNDAHNEYLQLLVETGIIGLALFLAAGAAVFRRLIRGMPSLSSADRELAAGLLAGVIALLVQNGFSVDMRFVISAVYGAIALGMLVALTEPRVQVPLPMFLRPSWARAGLGVVAALVLGVVSWGGAPPQLSFLGFISISRDGGIRGGAQGEGWGVLNRILVPHLARWRLAAEPDFFDIRVLDAARTLEELHALRDRYPGTPAIEERIGWVYAKERRFVEALRHFEAAAAADPSRAGAWNNAGNVLFLMGDRRGAIERYRRALAADPSLIDARLNLGIALLYEGLLAEATAELEEVLRRDPGNAKAVMTLRRMRE